jgi:hypothetical protein
MSGGHFDYDQYRIDCIAEEIERIIINNKENRLYRQEIENHFREALIHLKKAAIYTHCIDYLVSGDYGDDTFLDEISLRLRQLEIE